MLIYFIALFTAAFIIWLNNRSGETNRWAAFFLCSASIGGLANLPAAAEWPAAAAALQFLNYTITPYGVLVFAIVYAGMPASGSARRRLKLWLLLPVIVMAVYAAFRSGDRLFFVLLLLWSAPYYLAACGLLVYSTWMEREARARRSRFIATIIIVPTLLGVLAFIYVAKVFSPDFDFFHYISVFIIYSLGLALLCTFVYGVLGVRVRLEHDPLESTMKAVSTGAAMLNHTIKNEIGKISISTENLKSLLPAQDEESLHHMRIITNSANHMLEMVNRIHRQMKDIVLREEPVRLDLLTDACMRQHEGLMEKRKVRYRAEYAIRPVVICDPVHASEAIGNLMTNASEAMPGGGVIEFRLLPYKGGVCLSILDDGVGIDPEKLSQAFEPFYSSGKSGGNFGLGLSYVYNVMQKSGGKAEIARREGGGTKVSLIWPRKKTAESHSKGRQP
ncbi:sensor histidine kinase [Paenibacillus arenilitoris]|uniref:histidine kinase n=1 Tax=Paenibacillus arenilitoris TaxID=2772299 RepID=A0A927CKI4_9BACL|nr:HAMP domain-containing sensor histidine kinase [Paenibacillus arenilitoris]MBD2869758.1 HAMP domain-containing histidine kinase [Paenibacillus arenilitoris]